MAVLARFRSELAELEVFITYILNACLYMHYECMFDEDQGLSDWIILVYYNAFEMHLMILP